MTLNIHKNGSLLCCHSHEHGAERSKCREGLWSHLAELNVTDRGRSCAATHSWRRHQSVVIVHLDGLQLRPAPQPLRLHQLGVYCGTVGHRLAASLRAT